jgi:uncharacterized protein YndB with AHSA1/START domain
MTAPSLQSARSVADLNEGIVVATVEIGAPAERVFRALTDPKELTQWWGSPDTYRTEEWTQDLRVGGSWRASGRGADGHAFKVEGEFLEIDPPRKLVQTWKPEWDGGHVTTITYRLDAIDGGTRVTVRHAGFGDRFESCKNHGQGWERVLGWLGAHAAKPMFFLSRLLPPRPSFMLDMSDAEKKVMADHATYWRGLAARRVAVAYGPVMDPKGGWGVGILRVRDEAELDEVQKNDPAVTSGIGLRYESFMMPVVVVGERA